MADAALDDGNIYLIGTTQPQVKSESCGAKGAVTPNRYALWIASQRSPTAPVRHTDAPSCHWGDSLAMINVRVGRRARSQ